YSPVQIRMAPPFSGRETANQQEAAMLGMRRSSLLLIVFLVATPVQAEAGSRPVELGMDLGVEHLRTQGSTLWLVSLPGGGLNSGYQTGFRIGIPASDRVNVEPSAGFFHASSEGDSYSEWHATLSIVSDLGERRKGSTPYIRIGAGLVDQDGEYGSLS